MTSLRLLRLSARISLIFAVATVARAATFTVTTTANTGPGSFHQAITDANAAAGPDRIEFNVGAGGLQTFTLTLATNALPVVTDQVTIDGTTQPGFSGAPLIDLNGNLREASGLIINAPNCVVKSLIIRNYGRLSGATQIVNGIQLMGAGGNTIEDCLIGLTSDGTASSSIQGEGIFIDNSPNNTIDDCAIGGIRAVVIGPDVLGGVGVRIAGASATGNDVVASSIGTNAAGTAAVANSNDAILISGAGNNVIGGTTAGLGNLLSGNSRFGLLILGPNANGNTIAGNIIGLNAAGDAKLSNGAGVRIENSGGNTIGGTTAAARNIVSGNNGTGLLLIEADSDNNTITGNYIGTDITGTVDLGNSSDGLRLTAGASQNVIGGTAAGAGNLISGNGNTPASSAGGISISDPTTTGNIVQGNRIGSNATGTGGLRNSRDGIAIFDSPNNFIGGVTVAAGNIIGPNGNDTAAIPLGSGINISGPLSTGNLVQGNQIIDNARSGIHMRPGPSGTATGNTIGGPQPGAGNIIASNDRNGITVDGPNLLQRNLYFENGLLPVDVVRGDNEGDVTPPRPVITSAVSDGAITTAQFNFNAPAFPNTTFTFDFFTSSQTGAAFTRPQRGPSGRAEAREYVGSVTATTDGSGQASGQANFNDNLANDFLTAAVLIPDTPASEPYELASPIPIIDVPPTIGNSTTANNLWITTAGDPVNTANGELFDLESIDLNLRGPMPLRFFRYYASRLAIDRVPRSGLGANRLHNFDSRISFPDATHANVTTNRGRLVQFEKSGNAWNLIGRTDIAFQFVESGSNFILGHPRSQWMWTYDATGKLIKIEDGRGNAHTLTYTGSLLTSIADGLGRVLTLTYTSDKLTAVSDGMRTVSFAYTGANLTTSTDVLGKATTFSYGANGLLISKTKPEGNIPISQTFTGDKVTAQTERGTDTTSVAYNPNSTTITDPVGATLVHNYAVTGELSSYVDEGGKTMTFAFDATGRRSAVIDRLGDTTSFSFHAPSGKPATIVNAEGRNTTLTYSSRVLNGLTFFDLAQIVYPDGASESYLYDGLGNLTEGTDRAGKKWIFTYNNRGQPLTVTNPLGGIWTFTYDAAGNLASSQDSATAPSTYSYDALSRLIQIVRPDTTTVVLSYDPKDRILSIRDERNQTYAFSYDDNDNVTALTDPDGESIQLSYDALDRVVQTIDRLGRTSGVTFDARRLLTTVTDRNGNTTTLNYDARQRRTGIVDPGGKTWSFGYDDESQLTSLATPINPPSSIQRNKLGQPATISNPLGQTLTIGRDAMQRVTAINDPLGRRTAYSYDARGLLTGAMEDGAGPAQYTRDPLGRVTDILDPKGGVWAFTYTKEGRTSTMRDPLNQSATYSYDTRGRRNQITFADGATETRSYDGANNLTRRLFSDGLDLTYSYDDLNRLGATNEVEFSYDAEGRLLNSRQATLDFTASYDDGGRLLSVGYNNDALVVTYAYDTRDRLTNVRDNVSGAIIGFAYDDAGRVSAISRKNGVNATLSHDDAGRLIRIQDGTFLDLQYSRNAAGEITATNMTAPLVPSVQAGTASFAFNQASQISNNGYSYDARGRLVTAPGHSFAWDDLSRLRTADGTTFGYNGLNDIITRTADGTTTRYFHHYALGRAPIVAERNEATSQFTRFYICTPGGTLLYSIDPTNPNAPTYYHYDQVGSTLALTDASGTVTDSYAYSPFGEPLGHTGPSTQPFTYVGALGVRAEGTVYQMRARYYDPVSGRFLSRDPVWPLLARPKNLNPYEYAAQNPVRYVDPTGSKEETGEFTGNLYNVNPDSGIKRNSFGFYEFFNYFVAGVSGEREEPEPATDGSGVHSSRVQFISQALGNGVPLGGLTAPSTESPTQYEGTYFHISGYSPRAPLIRLPVPQQEVTGVPLFDKVFRGEYAYGEVDEFRQLVRAASDDLLGRLRDALRHLNFTNDILIGDGYGFSAVTDELRVSLLLDALAEELEDREGGYRVTAPFQPPPVAVDNTETM